MKKALATNLRKARRSHEQTQDTTSRFLGMKLSSYQKYEEGLAEPSAERLVQIANIFGIENLRAFITDPDWDPGNEFPKTQKLTDVSPLQTNYRRLNFRDRGLVDIILGIRTIE